MPLICTVGEGGIPRMPIHVVVVNCDTLLLSHSQQGCNCGDLTSLLATNDQNQNCFTKLPHQKKKLHPTTKKTRINKPNQKKHVLTKPIGGPILWWFLVTKTGSPRPRISTLESTTSARLCGLNLGDNLDKNCSICYLPKKGIVVYWLFVWDGRNLLMMKLCYDKTSLGPKTSTVIRCFLSKRDRCPTYLGSFRQF